MAACIRNVFSGHVGLSVAVANGDHMASLGFCTNLKIFIIGESFTIDCYGLSLGSYDMVVGVQWLESHGMILWDFWHRTMSFKRHGRIVHWSGSAPPEPLGPTIAAASSDVMGKLLLRFTPLFTEPTGLSPQRQRCHLIRLLPGTPPVVVRPYRYTHHQKQELERQCSEMLHQGVI
jgi:hypothetical protein